MDWLDWEKVKGCCTLINHKVKPEEVTSNTTSSIFEPPRNPIVTCESSESITNRTCEKALAEDYDSWLSLDKGPGPWFKLIFDEPTYVSGLQGVSLVFQQGVPLVFQQGVLLVSYQGVLLVSSRSTPCLLARSTPCPPASSTLCLLAKNITCLLARSIPCLSASSTHCLLASNIVLSPL
ncbi:hypothetical protein LSH36_452g00004 [Paralvinella palmiformis]|uniref:Uncharacterized protein n=1 Tax=Paralvinella palmiformis TaxID=53620 RepID=A0AAD9MXU9_9ANNE|nr:hypothetical protein LSH36_452g00004 [Paralvinella palmiformis]